MITVQMTNLLPILRHVLLPMFALSLVQILSHNLFFHGVSFATLSKA